MADDIPGGSVDLAAGPVVLENGIQGEALRIPTANPTGFHQALSEPEKMAETEILGSLFLPAGSGPWPVVAVVPGSFGVAPSHVAKADFLTDAGIACCVIDPFGARGVTSTVANQAQYTFAASAWDVLATAAALAARADIDATRIGAQGHSRGGSAVLSAACMARLIDAGRSPSLRAVYAAYPWSGMQFAKPDVGDTIVRSVIGTLDEWCLPQQVQGHMHAMMLLGCDASFRLFAAARHSFDRDTPVEFIADASVAPGAPTTFIREDGALIHPLSGAADPALTELESMRFAVKSGHGRRGAHIGSAGDQARLFHEDMMAFWRAALEVAAPNGAGSAFTPPMPRRPENLYDRYHAHVYFDASTADQARALCIAAWRECHVGLGRFHLRPVGPHPRWSCQLSFNADEFDRLIPWLDAHRDGLDILVHPLTDDALEEHTSLAAWLGREVALSVDVFQPDREDG